MTKDRTWAMQRMIHRLCQELYATEEQLFEHLVIEEWVRRHEKIGNAAQQAHKPDLPISDSQPDGDSQTQTEQKPRIVCPDCGMSTWREACCLDARTSG